MPRVDLSARYTRLGLPEPEPTVQPDGTVTGPFFAIPEDQYALHAEMKIPLSDYFLTMIHQHRAAFLTEDAQTLRADAEREGTALSSLEMFLDLVRMRASARVAQSSITALTRQRDDLKQLADAGFVGRVDVLRVEAALAEAKLALHRAASGEATIGASLRVLMKVPPEMSLQPKESLFEGSVPAAPPTEEVVANARAGRKEVASLRKLVEMRERIVAAKYGALFPHLALQAGADYGKPNSRTFDFENFRGTWELTVALTWSPNDFLGGWWDKDDSIIEMQKAQADLAVVEDGIEMQAHQAIAAYRTAVASITVAEEGLAAADGSFRDFEGLLEAGEVTTRDMLDAEATLRRAQLQWITAHLDARVSWARLQRAQGKLTESIGPSAETEGKEQP